MITAFVQFSLPQPATVEKAKEIFSSTSPKYRQIRGLLRKYYLLLQDGKTAGGIYLWNSIEEAKPLKSVYSQREAEFLSQWTMN